MEKLKKSYCDILDRIGETGSFKAEWRMVMFYSLFVYALVLAVRLSLAGSWDRPDLMVNGEHILATHDAYYWLAKAKGMGLMEGYPLAQAARWLHEWFGFSYEAIGFWSPAFMGALVGVVAYLWGWLMGGPAAGIVAGLLGSFSPGFFYRSRLGYFDTDMFTLLGPLAIALILAMWISSYLRPGWFREEERPDAPAVGHTAWWAVAAGLGIRLCGWWHHDILNVGIVTLCVAFGLILVVGRKGHRIRGCYELMIIVLAAFPGMLWGKMTLLPVSWLLSAVGVQAGAEMIAVISILLAASAAFALEHTKDEKSPLFSPWVCVGIGVVVCLSTNVVTRPLLSVVPKLEEYLSQSSTPASMSNGARVIFPAILQSIIEAKRIAFSVLLQRMAFWPWLGWLGLLSFALLAFLRPAALLLSPLVALSLSSMVTGVRFSMFGGTALLIGVSVVLVFGVRFCSPRLTHLKLVEQGAEIGLGVVFLFLVWSQCRVLPVTPVTEQYHAAALIELGKIAPKNSMVWTWWDWGYLTQYYAQRQTMVDGGRHSGADIYPVALVMTTQSPLQANQLIRFSSGFPAPNSYVFGYDPASYWAKEDAAKVVVSIQQMASEMQSFPVVAPQYLVVTWKDLTIAKWITYFGNWNLESGGTEQASISNYNPGELGINLQQGAVMSRQGGGGLVKDITVLDQKGAQSQTYFMNAVSPQLLSTQQHLIINKMTGQSVLMDRIAFRSLMTRLLTGDPEDPEIAPYFKLVVDKLPFARIYEVVQTINK